MPDIQHAIQMAAKPEAVYPLVATAHGLGQWWAADITDSSDTVDLGFFNRASVYRLKLEIDKPLVHVDWACQSGDEWAARISSFAWKLAGREACCVSPMAIDAPRPSISPRATLLGAASCFG